MEFTLALKKLPFEPDCNQIIYVEGKHDEEVNYLIMRNFWQIRECFAKHHFDFCYIPYLKKDLVSGERLIYNAPYSKSSKDADFMANDNFILDYLVHPENQENVPPSLLYFNPALWDSTLVDAENQFYGIEISPSSFVGDEGLSKILDRIIEDIEKHESPIRFSIRDFKEGIFAEDEEDDAKEKDEGIVEQRRGSGYMSAEEPVFINPDERLDKQAAKWWHEIEDNIEKLRQKGIESALIEQLFRNYK